MWINSTKQLTFFKVFAYLTFEKEICNKALIKNKTSGDENEISAIWKSWLRKTWFN